MHEFRVHYFRMKKNITLSAESNTIEQARRRASAENTTVNELFRAWLDRYVAQPTASDAYDALMARFDHVNSGQHFRRDEMNERYPDSRG